MQVRASLPGPNRSAGLARRTPLSCFQRPPPVSRCGGRGSHRHRHRSSAALVTMLRIQRQAATANPARFSATAALRSSPAAIIQDSRIVRQHRYRSRSTIVSKLHAAGSAHPRAPDLTRDPAAIVLRRRDLAVQRHRPISDITSGRPVRTKCSVGFVELLRPRRVNSRAISTWQCPAALMRRQTGRR